MFPEDEGLWGGEKVVPKYTPVENYCTTQWFEEAFWVRVRFGRDPIFLSSFMFVLFSFGRGSICGF
jgi:hypothetical protein